MGSIGSTARLAAFQSDIFAVGLDLGRCKYHNDGGFYKAASGAVIRQGMLVTRDASGEVQPATGPDVFGVSKWRKETLGVSVTVDEAVTFTGNGSTVNLARANVSNVAVRSAQDFGGTLYVEGAGNDYVLNATNGTLTHVAGGAIGGTDTVYVTYTYALTDADYQFQGRNWFNSNDNATLQEGRITVITDWAILFTTEWDTSRTYAMTGAASNLYCSAAGKFTNDASGGGDYVGKVFQLATAGDPYMGVQMTGMPQAQ